MREHEDQRQKLTRHAETRMSQRGFKLKDLDLIRLYGTPVKDGFLVTQNNIQLLGRDLQRLERIVGARLVENAGTPVTVYRASKKVSTQAHAQRILT